MTFLFVVDQIIVCNHIAAYVTLHVKRGAVTEGQRDRSVGIDLRLIEGSVVVSAVVAVKESVPIDVRLGFRVTSHHTAKCDLHGNHIRANGCVGGVGRAIGGLGADHVDGKSIALVGAMCFELVDQLCADCIGSVCVLGHVLIKVVNVVKLCVTVACGIAVLNLLYRLAVAVATNLYVETVCKLHVAVGQRAGAFENTTRNHAARNGAVYYNAARNLIFFSKDLFRSVNAHLGTNVNNATAHGIVTAVGLINHGAKHVHHVSVGKRDLRKAVHIHVIAKVVHRNVNAVGNLYVIGRKILIQINTLNLVDDLVAVLVNVVQHSIPRVLIIVCGERGQLVSKRVDRFAANPLKLYHDDRIVLNVAIQIKRGIFVDHYRHDREIDRFAVDGNLLIVISDRTDISVFKYRCKGVLFPNREDAILILLAGCLIHTPFVIIIILDHQHPAIVAKVCVTKHRVINGILHIVACEVAFRIGHDHSGIFNHLCPSHGRSNLVATFKPFVFCLVVLAVDLKDRLIVYALRLRPERLLGHVNVNAELRGHCVVALQKIGERKDVITLDRELAGERAVKSRNDQVAVLIVGCGHTVADYGLHDCRNVDRYAVVDHKEHAHRLKLHGYGLAVLILANQIELVVKVDLQEVALLVNCKGEVER